MNSSGSCSNILYNTILQYAVFTSIEINLSLSSARMGLQLKLRSYNYVKGHGSERGCSREYFYWRNEHIYIN